MWKIEIKIMYGNGNTSSCVTRDYEDAIDFIIMRAKQEEGKELKPKSILSPDPHHGCTAEERAIKTFVRCTECDQKKAIENEQPKNKT